MELPPRDQSHEPLLPRSHSIGGDTPPRVYGREPAGMLESPAGGLGFFGRSPKRMRDKYVRELGYTPLVFQRIHTFLGQFSPFSPARARRKPVEEDLSPDSFPYHQSLIPSKGSIRGSVFNLAGATLGAGALSLPYAVSVSGVGFALAQLITASLLTVYTIRLLIRAGNLTKLKSYEDLALYCFGPKVAIFVEINILVFCFGIAVAYLVTLGDLLKPLGDLCFGAASLFAQRWVLMTMACMTIMFPLSLLKDISSLQFSSILGVLSIFFLVFAVCVRSVMIMRRDGSASDINWLINLEHGPDFMLSVPIMMFAFTCQVNVFSIYTELQRPCIRRMNKVVDSATLISVLVYAVIGLVAYFAFGSSLAKPENKGNILLSFPLSDTLIAFARAAITFTVAVAFPLNIFPCRFTIDMMFFASSKDSLLRHTLVTTGLVFSALLLAIFCPSINVVFGIIGGTCSTVVCFCFPAAFILKLEEGSWVGKNKIGPLILFVGAVIIGTAGTIITVWSNFFKQ